AGVVHQQVERLPIAAEAVGEHLPLFTGGDVETFDTTFAAGAAYQIDRLGPSLLVEIADGDIPPVAGKAKRDCPSQAAGATGDDRITSDVSQRETSLPNLCNTARQRRPADQRQASKPAVRVRRSTPSPRWKERRAYGCATAEMPNWRSIQSAATAISS